MRRNILIGILLFGAEALFVNAASAQVIERKLLASDGAPNDFFGLSVSISGEYVIVGAAEDDDIATGSGSAYIFHRGGLDWGDETKLTASDGATYDHFGASVSISGDYAVVGAPWDDDDGFSSGSAYVFHREGANWVEESKFTASDGVTDDRFGTSVSISGDYVVVGANEDDDNGYNAGSAYIFRHEGADWVEETKLTASDGGAYDNFGTSVSISGDYAIVGASGDNDNGSHSGSAYVFRREGSDWVEETKLTASDGDYDDYFGTSVSISGVYAIVGAPYDDDNGDSGLSVHLPA